MLTELIKNIHTKVNPFGRAFFLSRFYFIYIPIYVCTYMQDETETITDYIIMYQHQRKQQKLKMQVGYSKLALWFYASKDLFSYTMKYFRKGFL